MFESQVSSDFAVNILHLNVIFQNEKKLQKKRENAKKWR